MKNKQQEMEMILQAFKGMGATDQQLDEEKVKLQDKDYFYDWLETLWIEDCAERADNRYS